jgi:hypothetical protein
MLFSQLDPLIAFLLAAGSVAYLAAMPRLLGPTDEGLYLYGAKRILDGDVFYRDIYDIVTPAAHYVMALAFLLFGTSIVTARGVIAVVHAIAIAAMYGAARAAGVRRAFAVLPALAYVGLCQPTFPYASPHWFNTALCMVLLWILLRDRRSDGRRAAALGLVVGVMIVVQHQRGSMMGAAMATILLIEHLLDRRFGGTDTFAALMSRLLALAGVAALIVVPVFVEMLATAGFRPVYRALVEHPFITYRATMRASWGYTALLTAQPASFTSVLLLKLLPLGLVAPLLRAARDWWLRTNRDEAHVLTLLIAFAGFSVASIAYFPDFIHIALIAPVFFIAIVETLDWLVGMFPGRAQRPIGLALALCLLAALGAHLYRNLARARASYSVRIETRFGAVDFAPRNREIALIAEAEEVLADVPSRQMFAYPGYASLYLMAGANNPTPYPLLIPRYNFDDQLIDATEILERKKVPIVLLYRRALQQNDIVFRYVRDHYDPIDKKEMFWRRRDTRG